MGNAARPSLAVTVSTDVETELREVKSWTEIIQQNEDGTRTLTQGLSSGPNFYYFFNT